MRIILLLNIVVVVEAHLSRAEVVSEAWQGVEPANLAVEAPAGRQARHRGHRGHCWCGQRRQAGEPGEAGPRAGTRGGGGVSELAEASVLLLVLLGRVGVREAAAPGPPARGQSAQHQRGEALRPRHPAPLVHGASTGSLHHHYHTITTVTIGARDITETRGQVQAAGTGLPSAVAVRV